MATWPGALPDLSLHLNPPFSTKKRAVGHVLIVHPGLWWHPTLLRAAPTGVGGGTEVTLGGQDFTWKLP